MSLLLAGLVVLSASGAMMVGRWLGRRREGRDGPDDGKALPAKADDAKSEKADKAEATKDAPAKKIAAKEKEPVALDGFPCQLGDVVTRITGEEAWLAGGIVLSEEMPVTVLFVAPDAGHDCALYARPKPGASLAWLAPLDPGAVLVGGEPPSSVEHGGVRFDRVRRLPLRPRRIGVGAPDVGDAVTVAEYASAGDERLLVLKGSNGQVRAFRGHELEASSYEVIASGRSTLDE